MFPGAKPDFDLDEEELPSVLPSRARVKQRSPRHSEVTHGHGNSDPVAAIDAPIPPAKKARKPQGMPAYGTGYGGGGGGYVPASLRKKKAPKRAKRKRRPLPEGVRRAFSVAGFSATAGICLIAISAPTTRLYGLEPMFGVQGRLEWNETGLQLGQAILVFAAVLFFFAALYAFSDRKVEGD